MGDKTGEQVTLSLWALWAAILYGPLFCDKVMWCFVLQWSCEVDIIIPILPTRKLRFREISKLLGSRSCELWSWNSNTFTYNTVCIPKTVWIPEWFFGFKLPLPFISCMIWGILLNFSESQFPHTKMRLREFLGSPVVNLPGMYRPGFDLWVAKTPWRRAWQDSSIPAWRIPVDRGACSPWGHKESDMTERLSD